MALSPATMQIGERVHGGDIGENGSAPAQILHASKAHGREPLKLRLHGGEALEPLRHQTPAVCGAHTVVQEHTESEQRIGVRCPPPLHDHAGLFSRHRLRLRLDSGEDPTRPVHLRSAELRLPVLRGHDVLLRGGS